MARSLPLGAFQSVARPQLQKLILEASQKFVHHPALQRKCRKTQIAEERHFKHLRSLADGKNIKPFCRRPIIPEFPENSANRAPQKETPEDRGFASFQFTQERLPLPVMDHRV